MRTLADHSRTITALHKLAAEYPLLPAPSVRTISYCPRDLEVTCSDLAEFEQWREALHVDADSIEYEITDLGRIHLLGEADFDGVTVLIHGYSPRARVQAVKAVA